MALVFWRTHCMAIVRYTTNMFRISTTDTPHQRRLVVEGKLVEPWTSELRKTWGASGEDLHGRQRIIDLTNVTVISREGEEAILELMRSGAKFCCAGILIKHVVKQLTHRCGPTSRVRAESLKKGG